MNKRLCTQSVRQPSTSDARENAPVCQRQGGRFNPSGCLPLSIKGGSGLFSATSTAPFATASIAEGARAIGPAAHRNIVMKAMSQTELSGQPSSQRRIAATAIDFVKAAAGCDVADVRTATAMNNAKMVCQHFPIAA